MNADPNAGLLIHPFRLNSTLFLNCLDGVDESMARVRLANHVNNLHFLAVHLVDARFYMDALLGGSYEAPFPELAEVRSVDEMPEPGPPIEQVRLLWREISDRLTPRLASVSAEVLGSKSPFEFPPTEAPQEGRFALSFLLHHESYHVGQMAFIRKGLGLPAMRYD